MMALVSGGVGCRHEGFVHRREHDSKNSANYIVFLGG
eukprot:SAG22_NODE_16815_length_317_cov_0.706422_2_plen_36_part_01